MAKKIVKAAVKAVKGPKPIGEVTHFYGNIKVAVVKFKKDIYVGTEIEIKGATTDFKQKIESMQYEHDAVKIAKKGMSVGMKVSKRVREGDLVFEAEK